MYNASLKLIKFLGLSILLCSSSLYAAEAYYAEQSNEANAAKAYALDNAITERVVEKKEKSKAHFNTKLYEKYRRLENIKHNLPRN